MTAAEVDQAIQEWFQGEDETDYGDHYSEFAERLENGEWNSENSEYDHAPMQLGSLGQAEFVDHFGGEGQGDEYWVVFRIGNEHFRIDGWYASYDGGEFTGVSKVTPKEKTITVYE